MLAPFMKSPLKATLRGVTNDPCDPTVWEAQEFRRCDSSNSGVFNLFLHWNALSCLLKVDVLKTTAVPLMRKFGIDGEGLELKVKSQPPKKSIVRNSAAAF